MAAAPDLPGRLPPRPIEGLGKGGGPMLPEAIGLRLAELVRALLVGRLALVSSSCFCAVHFLVEAFDESRRGNKRGKHAQSQAFPNASDVPSPFLRVVVQDFVVFE